MRQTVLVIVTILVICSGAVFAQEPARQILYYSFSQGFEHGPVKLAKDGGPSPSDRGLMEIGQAHKVKVVCTKDGRVFDGDLSPYAAFVFYATGDLLKEGKDAHPEKNPSRPMTRKGFDNLLTVVRGGKGLVGFHAATDARIGDDTDGEVNPYTKLIGARFTTHGKQQDATMLVSVKGVPSLNNIRSFVYFDEWYAMNHFNPDMRVILVQETAGMEGKEYARPPYPALWIRREGKGRVGYCSMGHNDSFFQESVSQGGIWEFLSWGMGDFEIEMTPNFLEVTPKAEGK